SLNLTFCLSINTFIRLLSNCNCLSFLTFSRYFNSLFSCNSLSFNKLLSSCPTLVISAIKFYFIKYKYYSQNNLIIFHIYTYFYSMINRQTFYQKIKANGLFSKLTAKQVEGMDAVIDEWEANTFTD